MREPRAVVVLRRRMKPTTTEGSSACSCSGHLPADLPALVLLVHLEFGGEAVRRLRYLQQSPFSMSGSVAQRGAIKRSSRATAWVSA